ncbi:MAG TPA: PEP-CTERM sorting domain-containing protein [Bryobacteraceae bacterium]|nr:PEP-CTERM sorting domain-containing protein [Bryobacteraceae bacterium]
MARHQFSFSNLRIVIGFLLVAGVAGAAPVINIFPSIGPDIDVAATFSQYSANALFALENGLSSYGSAGTPSYYERASSFESSDVVSTYNYFQSWRGETPPPAGYDGQYGNMLYWGAAIQGNGERFSLNNVIYTESFLGDTYGALLGGSIGFGTRAIGIYFGADRVLGGGDDIRYVGGGTAGTMIDVLYFTGMGAAFLVDDASKLQYYLDNIRIADYPSARGGYLVNTNSGVYSGTQTLAMSDAVPEPATFGFVGAGLLAIAYAARRWKR